jgi:hypothetical protein
LPRNLFPILEASRMFIPLLLVPWSMSFKHVSLSLAYLLIKCFLHDIRKNAQ